MLHPADPRLDIPLEQLTVAVVAVTELLLPAVTVGLVVQEAGTTAFTPQTTARFEDVVMVMVAVPPVTPLIDRDL